MPVCLYAWVFLHPQCVVATICSMANYSHGRTLSNLGLQLVLSSHRMGCFKLRTEGRKEGGIVGELGLPSQVQTYIFTSKIRYYALLLGCKSSFFRASHSYLSHEGPSPPIYTCYQQTHVRALRGWSHIRKKPAETLAHEP